MRSRCFCSATVAVVLAGCGSSPGRAPYSYDTHAPLRVLRGPPLNAAGGARLYDFSYRGANGSVVQAFLVAAATPGRHPGVLLLHGSGGTDADLLVPAAELALRGAVALTISMPNDAATYRPLVVDARRGLDALQSLRSVDSKRLGIIGYSLGAQTAAIVAGVDERPRAVAIVAGRGTVRARQFVRRTHAKLLFVAGTNDERVTRVQLLALMRAAPDHPAVRWFPTTHSMSTAALEYVIAWEAARLGSK
jgi:dienelactone hydrolase